MGYIELNEFGVLVIYKSKMDCLWNIIINGYIEFVFICLDIEDKVDIVIVYDGLLWFVFVIGILFGNIFFK